MIKGLVSVIIPTYKRCECLIIAINSVLAQTYSNLEVLVVDDNNPNDEYSTALQEKIKKIKDDRVRYVQQERHINGAAARNTGIRAARGEFIAFLDDDDSWMPEKLEKQLEILNAKPSLGGVSCLYKHYKKGIAFRRCPIYNTDNLHRDVLGRSISVSTPTLLLRKKCLDEAGYFDETLIRHQEIQLLLDFLIKYNIELVKGYYVIVNYDSTINRPDMDKMLRIKKDFFDKEQKHFLLYDQKTQRRLYAAHYFEVMHVALNERKIGIFIKYWLKIGFNINAYKDIYKRYITRIKFAIKA